MRLALVGIAALVASAPPADGDSAVSPGQDVTIGVVPQRTIEDGETDLMSAAGISSTRVWFSWAQVEAIEGERDWGPIDQTVATNARGGMTTLPFLFGTPGWAAAEDDQDCLDGECASFPPRSTQTRNEFGAFAAAAARRYGPGGTFWAAHRGLPYLPIDVWQIWNEPNLSSFYRPAVDPISYAALVQAGARAIRAEDPHAEILLAGLTGTRTNAKRMSTTTFLTQLYSVAGIASSFDGVAVHPYNRQVRGVIDQVDAARSIASEHADHPDLWITELGWASAGKRRWGLVTTRSGQARMLGRTFARLIDNADRLDLRGVYWYAWRDTDRGQAVCGWCPWSGLLDRDGHRKPAYFELRDLWKNLVDAQ